MTTLREAHRYMLTTTGTEDTITQALPQLDNTTDAPNTAARQIRPQRARRTRPARVKLTCSRLVTEHRSPTPLLHRTAAHNPGPKGHTEPRGNVPVNDPLLERLTRPCHGLGCSGDRAVNRLSTLLSHQGLSKGRHLRRVSLGYSPNLSA